MKSTKIEQDDLRTVSECSWRDLNSRSLSICCEGVERIELQPFSKERGYCFNLAPHHGQGRVGRVRSGVGIADGVPVLRL